MSEATSTPAPTPAATDAPTTTAAASTTSSSSSSTTETKDVVSTKNDSGELDLVFCMDCTGSMGSYIQAAQNNIVSIVEKIVASEKADVRFGLVAYRDHPPQDSTFVTQVYDFTSSYKKMVENVRQLQARGGGDGPEAVTAGMDSVLKMDYRKSSVKICVLIADAPPHGLGEQGDGFPNGDPDGRDPLQLARQMLERGITCYTVGCEPTLSSSYQYAADFFEAVAKITSGKFLPLSSAQLLADVIIGGAQEELALAKVMEQVQEEVATQQKALPAEKKLNEDEIAERVAEALAKKGVETNQLSVDEINTNRSKENIDALFSAASLSAAKQAMKPVNKPQQIQKPMALGAAVARSRSSLSNIKPTSAMPLRQAKVASEAPSDDDLFSSSSAAASAPAPMAQQVYNKKAAISSSQVKNLMYRSSNKK